MKKLAFIFLLMLAAASAATAQTTYAARALYNVAHPSNYIIDFNNITAIDGTFYPSGLSVSTPVGSVGFTGLPLTATSTELLRATHFGFASPANDNNYVLYGNAGQFATNSFQINLPANTFTFGTDIISPSSTVPEPYTFTIMSGASILGVVTPILSASGQYTFFGFDSLTTAITSVQVQITNAIGNPEPVLDNFTVVPEPTTIASFLVGTGLLAAVVSRRNKK
jgi:hypothetical protein